VVCSQSVALVTLVIWLHLRRLSVYQDIVRNPSDCQVAQSAKKTLRRSKSAFMKVTNYFHRVNFAGTAMRWLRLDSGVLTVFNAAR
jgi:hypothetical protein